MPDMKAQLRHRPGRSSGLREPWAGAGSEQEEAWCRVTEDDRSIKIETDKLEAVIPKSNPKQWMTGVEKGSFLDKATGFREVGDGLMVVDWLMEPGSDAEYGDQVVAPDGQGVGRYSWFENETDPERRAYTLMAHGSSHRKRMVEGPQLCHRMKPVTPEVIRGAGLRGGEDDLSVRVRSAWAHAWARDGLSWSCFRVASGTSC